jgi:glycosyltransferase involved in cell wall biosynthesis
MLMAEAVTAAQTSVVIPAFNEGASIATVVRDLAAAAQWLEILVVDDGSSDETGANAAAAGARVIRHPYNKGNGAAVKSGIRQAAGVFILIADADGQHRPADATRLVAQLDRYDLVVGARSGQTQASLARRLGNSALNRIASYLTEQLDSGSDVGISGAARLPPRVHPSAAQRLLDADDHDARIHAGRLQRALRAG